MTETTFNTIYNFVEDMTPDMEMTLDFCESQGITITDDVINVIDDLICNATN